MAHTKELAKCRKPLPVQLDKHSIFIFTKDVRRLGGTIRNKKVKILSQGICIYTFIDGTLICTALIDSYNESLLIIKRSTCFGIFSPSSGAKFWSCISELVYAGTSGG